jgi:hypothetical protein
LDQPQNDFDLSPDERFHELARLLAIGVRRHFATRAKLASSPGAENCQKSERDGLEVPDETVLSVYGG